MDLFLRQVIHSAAPENYRVVIRDSVEIEIRSIGRQFDSRFWGIDTVLPMREMEAEGYGKDRAGSFYLSDHLKASKDAAETRLQENDPEGVAFEYEGVE